MQDQGGSDIPLVPWSRHMSRQKQTQSKDKEEKPLNSQLSDYKRRQLVFAGRIKAISESSLSNGARVRGGNDDGDSWDSQSDPGSTSPNVKGFRHSGNKPIGPIQGRGNVRTNELRRRKKGKQHDGSATIGRGELVVEISMENLPTSREVRQHKNSLPFAEQYIDFMYYCCLAPYSWEKAETIAVSKRQYALSIVKKVIFCYIGLMSAFTSFNLIKFFVLQFIIDRSMNNFIDIGYFTLSRLFNAYLTYFLAFRYEEMSTTLQTCKEFDALANKEFDSKVKWVPMVNGIISIIMSAVKIVALAASYEELVLDNSRDTAEGLILWTPDQMRNMTTITDVYATELNWPSWTLGTFGVISQFCYNVQMDCYKDLIFWIAKYNEGHVVAFGKMVKNCLGKKMKTGKNSDKEDDHCWETYRQVKRVDTLINEKFYNSLLLIHLYSFFTFSFFLTFLLNEDAGIVLTLIIGYHAVKGVMSYMPGQRASRENDICRKWIQTLPCETKRFCVGETPYTREVMLWELEKEPLGLGNGKLNVNNEFIITFISLVASLFCFLLSIENKTGEVKKY